MTEQDLKDKRFGRLLAISPKPSDPTRWLCKCDCGRTVSIKERLLPRYRSCGCMEIEIEELKRQLEAERRTNQELRKALEEDRPLNIWEKIIRWFNQ